MLRFGTVLRLIQDILNEPTSVIAKRINLPVATITAYQAGIRFPRNELHSVYRALTKFFQATLPELGYEYYDSGQFLSEALSLEKSLRRITDFNPILFQRAATKLLIIYIRDHDKMNNRVEDTVGLKKSLSFALKRAGLNQAEKHEVARCLFEISQKNFFLDLSSDGTLKPLRFLGLNDLPSIVNMPFDALNVLVNLPLCLDILMSLPDRIEISIDNNNDFQSTVRLTHENDFVEVQGGKLVEIKF